MALIDRLSRKNKVFSLFFVSILILAVLEGLLIVSPASGSPSDGTIQYNKTYRGTSIYDDHSVTHTDDSGYTLASDVDDSKMAFMSTLGGDAETFVAYLGQKELVLSDMDSYDFSTKTRGTLSGGDFYYSDASGVGSFYANNVGQSGLQDLGNVGSVALSAVVIPSGGYTRSGANAVVGHTYVSLAQAGEEGNYIVFRVISLMPDYSNVTIEYVYRSGLVLSDMDSYDFSTKTRGTLSGGDFYYSDASGVGSFYANNVGQSGLQDIGDYDDVALSAVVIPSGGYTRFGANAVVGHTYVSLAQAGEEGNYIVFRVISLMPDYSNVTIEYVYRSGLVLSDMDSYDFSTKTRGTLSGGDFYYSDASGVGSFYANNVGQSGLQDIGDYDDVALSAVVIPSGGYTRFGANAVVGHTYVSLAQAGEEGNYIVFRVISLMPDYSNVTIEYVYRSGLVLSDMDSYDFSTKTRGTLSGGDFYYSDASGVGSFYANNVGQSGLQDIGDYDDVALSAVVIPSGGYTRFGANAVVGHTYVSLAQAGEEGNYIVFRVISLMPDYSNVTIECLYRDAFPPTGSVIINGGTDRTTSRSVTLTLSATDMLTVSEMRFSENMGSNWGDWVAYSPTFLYTITSPNDGFKRIDVQFKDNADNPTTVGTIYDGIILDTAPPFGSIIINSGNPPTTTTTSVMLYLTYSDTTSGVYQVRYSNDGVWDTEPWEAPSATKAWTLTSGAGLKTVYYQIKDDAGLTTIYSDDITLTATFGTKGLKSYYWTGNTVVNSVASGDVDQDGVNETVTGGYFFDGTRTIAQLIVWSGANLAVDRLTSWYWTGNTTINSVALRDVDGDGQVEIVTGGSFYDGTRNVAQLIVWSGANLGVKRLTSWYWTGNTVINSVALGEVDSDGQTEVVTGGAFFDGTRNIAQLIEWNGATLAVDRLTSWYWTSDTVINSVALRDVDSDGQVEVVTGGFFNDGVRNIAQLIEWNGANLAVDRLTSWYWTGNTVVNSVALGDVDGDGQVEVVTGGFFNDGVRNIAQLIEWNGANLAVDRLTSWYWTGNTVVNSVALGDVDGDGQVEVVTGGFFNDGVRNIAQLIEWNGSNLVVDRLTSWYWTSNTVINSVAIGDVDGDSQNEVVTGGYFNDGARNIAQLTVWGMI